MFKSMKIGLRMGLGFGLVIVLMIATGLFAMNRIGALDDGFGVVVNDRWPKAVQANTVRNLLDDAMISVSTATMQDDPGEMKKTLQHIADVRAEYAKTVEQLTGTVKSEAGKAALAAVAGARAKWGETMNDTIRLIESGDKAQAKAVFLERVRSSAVDYSNAVAGLINLEGKLVNEAGMEAEESAHLTRTMVLIALGGSFALALFVVFFVTRSITGPLSEAVAINKKLAEGDLSVAVDVSRGG